MRFIFLIIDMKHLFFSILILISLLSFGQESKKERAIRESDEQYVEWLSLRDSIKFPLKDGKVVFEIVDSINVIGINKGDLVTAFKQALADVLKEAKRAIDVDDREGGAVVAKVTDFYSVTHGKTSVKKALRFTINFDSKEGRYRLQISDIEVKWGNQYPFAYIDSYAESKFHPIPVNELLIRDRKNYNKMTKEGRERSILLKSELQRHFDIIIKNLSALVNSKAKDDF